MNSDDITRLSRKPLRGGASTPDGVARAWRAGCDRARPRPPSRDGPRPSPRDNPVRLPQSPSLAELAALGVARVSWGPFLYRDPISRFADQLASLQG